jgi:hypothetical protein
MLTRPGQFSGENGAEQRATRVESAILLGDLDTVKWYLSTLAGSKYFPVTPLLPPVKVTPQQEVVCCPGGSLPARNFPGCAILRRRDR